MKTETLTRDADTEPVPYLPVHNGVITLRTEPSPEPQGYAIELPNGRLRCRTLSVAGDTHTAPIVYRVGLAQAWQELKNYRRAVSDLHGMPRGVFRPRLVTWPECQPVRRVGVASLLRRPRRRPSRQAVAR